MSANDNYKPDGDSVQAQRVKEATLRILNAHVQIFEANIQSGDNEAADTERQLLHTLLDKHLDVVGSAWSLILRDLKRQGML